MHGAGLLLRAGAGSGSTCTEGDERSEHGAEVS